MFLDATSNVGIGAHRGFDARAVGGVLGAIQLAICVRHQQLFGDDHDAPPSGPPSSASSASRPRARRLVTVPMGTSSTAAASLYASPSISTSATTSRCSSG